MAGNPSKDRVARQREERRVRRELERFIAENEAKRKAARKLEGIVLRQAGR